MGKAKSETWDEMRARHSAEESAWVREALAANGWKIAPTSRATGVPATTLQRALERDPKLEAEVERQRAAANRARDAARA